jgi:hypothetical protein
LEKSRIPGYVGEESDSSRPTKDPDGSIEVNKTSTVEDGKNDSSTSGKDKGETKKPSKPNVVGFTEGSGFVEIRGGTSLWIGGPALSNLNSGIKANGYDTVYTYNYGNDIQKAGLYSGIQNYSGVKMKGIRMGFLYDKAVSERWSIGGGIDYREYKVDNVPNNLFSRSLIQGTGRFPGGVYIPTQEDINRNIGYEYLGLGTTANSIVANKIVFLEVNASYHFLPERHWDPYLRPIFGIGYDTTSKNYALKLGGAGGLRYFFKNGIYLGGEIGADTIYLAQDQIVKSQSKTRIYDATYSFFIGKKFD